MTALGIVVIGRNEAPRLAACLRSVVTPETPVIYVDSASSDESVAIARGAGCMVHELDASRPLSAARARNEGLDRLLASHPRLELIQFVDGDCEILPGWIEAARRELEAMPQVVIVCGRVRERSRARSIYSRLCDIDANRPPGETTSCGGLFMTRMAQFREVGGFEPSVVAGEEAELCLRLRRRGFRVIRLPVAMAIHDADMMHFRQWWRRTARTGHAYAQAAFLHGGAAERHGVRQSLAIWVWAIGLPGVAIAFAWATRGWSFFILIAYLLQMFRVALQRRVEGDAPGDRWLYGVTCVAAKLPQLFGQLKFMHDALRGRDPTIMEHRAPPPASARTLQEPIDGAGR